MSADDPRVLKLARCFAEVGHDGQTRKGSGEPYFNHPMRVAEMAGVLGVRAAAVGYLHDLVEDTPIDFRTLGQLFPWAIVRDVWALTRNPGRSAGYPLYPLPGNPYDVAITDETYREFIGRTILEGSDTALQVKLADIMDNLCDPWLREQPKLAARYVKADVRIRTELWRRGVRGIKPLVV